MKISRVLLLLFCLVSTFYYFAISSWITEPIMPDFDEEDALIDTICKKTSLKYLNKEDKLIVKSICKDSICIINEKYHFFYRKMRYQKHIGSYIEKHLIWVSIYLFIAFFSNKYVNKFHNYWLYACFTYAVIVTL